VVVPAAVVTGWWLEAGLLKTAIVKSTEDQEADAVETISLIGTHFFGPRIERPEGRVYVGGTPRENIAWGEAFAQAYLGQDPFALGVVFREAVVSADTEAETAALALVRHEDGAVVLSSTSDLTHGVCVDWHGIGFSVISGPLADFPVQLVSSVAQRFYCPVPSETVGIREITRSTPEGEKWCRAFAQGFLGMTAESE
jgi:hypothetical protein